MAIWLLKQFAKHNVCDDVHLHKRVYMYEFLRVCMRARVWMYAIHVNL